MKVGNKDMVKINRYTLLALAGTVLLSSGFIKLSEAAGLESIGSSLASSASSVASFADNALGQIQDYTCQASGASSLLTGYAKEKVLGAAGDAMGDFRYSSQVIRELRKTTPSVNECHNTERGKALNSAMIIKEKLSYQKRLESWQNRKAVYNARGIAFDEVPPKEPGDMSTTFEDDISFEDERAMLSGDSVNIKGEPSWKGRKEMWINQPSWGSDLASSLVGDGINKIASSVTNDPATQKLIRSSLGNGVDAAVK